MWKNVLLTSLSATTLTVGVTQVVSCGDSVTLESIANKIKDEDKVKTTVTAFIADTSKTEDVINAVRAKLKEELKTGLKDKKEFEAVANLADNKDAFDIKVEVDSTDKTKAKITIDKKAWKAEFVTNEEKKADEQATYDSIKTGSVSIVVEQKK